MYLNISRHLSRVGLDTGAYQVQAGGSRWTYGNRVCKRLCYGLSLLNGLIHEQQSSLEMALDIS